jgi:hypothetical protein
MELLRLHDPDMFDVHILSTNPCRDAKYMVNRESISIIDISGFDVIQAVTLILGKKFDVLIDFDGVVGTGKGQIFDHKPASASLGFPFCSNVRRLEVLDYLILDERIIREVEVRSGIKKIINMRPTTFPAVNFSDLTPDQIICKEHIKNSADEIIYCCLNDPETISRQLFMVWTKILKESKGARLVLKSSEPRMMEKFRDEVSKCGISNERVIFLDIESLEDYLACLQGVDIYLDTYPINGPFEAWAALWSGCPVVTCRGQGLISRQVASINESIGLSVLNADSIDSYKDLGTMLARKGSIIKDVKSYILKLKKQGSLSEKVFWPEEYFDVLLKVAGKNYIRRQKSVACTTYFTSKPDPQRGTMSNPLYHTQDSIKYIFPWYASVNTLQQRACVFYDDLSESFVDKYTKPLITFKKVKLGKGSVNDERFRVYRHFVEETQFDVYAFTDGADVLIKERIDNLVVLSGTLYVGKDMPTTPLIMDSEWMVKLVKSLRMRTGFSFRVPVEFFEFPLYNAGIILARRNEILIFLDMVNKILDRLSINQNNNMFAFNYALFLLRDVFRICSHGKYFSQYKCFETWAETVFVHK